MYLNFNLRVDLDLHEQTKKKQTCGCLCSFVFHLFHFSLNTFRYKGLLNCAGEHRGELCWESADFRAERPRPLLLFIIVISLFSLCFWVPHNENSPESHEKWLISRSGEISLPREPILDSVIVWACSACSAFLACLACSACLACLLALLVCLLCLLAWLACLACLLGLLALLVCVVSLLLLRLLDLLACLLCLLALLAWLDCLLGVPA